MAGDPAPIGMKSRSHITAFGRSHMNRSGMTHTLIDMICESEDFSVIGTHTIGHQILVNANHMSMTHLKFISQERQQRDAERDLSGLSSRNVIGNGGMELQK